MRQMQNLHNPQEMLQNLTQKYPMLQQIFAIQQKNGVSLQQIAEVMAQQKGANLNQLIQELQS